MSGSFNKAQLIGNLGNDPEVRSTQAGTKIASLSIATSESWKDKHSGERVEKTEWHRVVIFIEPLAEFAEKYLAKGAKVFVEGALRTRKWQDQAGNDRYTTEIHLSPFNGRLILLDRRQNDDRQASGKEAARAPAGAGAAPNWQRSGDLDDEIPF